MSCECYKIGGPWITYDPSCPTHGDTAQAEERERELEQSRNEAEMSALRAELDAWRNRFPQYVYRPQDDVVSLRKDL